MTDWSQYARNWATGMAHAEPRMRAARAAAQTMAVANRQRGDCYIKGCKNTARPGELCAKHSKMVPKDDKMKLMVELLVAQQRITHQHHRRWARELAKSLRTAA